MGDRAPCRATLPAPVRRACVRVCVSGWESRSRFVLCEKATYIHIQASGDPLPAARSSSHGSKKREVTVKSSVAPQSRVRTSQELALARESLAVFGPSRARKRRGLVCRRDQKGQFLQGQKASPCLWLVDDGAPEAMSPVAGSGRKMRCGRAGPGGGRPRPAGRRQRR